MRMTTATAAEESIVEEDELWPIGREIETAVYHDVYGEPTVVSNTVIGDMKKGMKEIGAIKWRIVIPLAILIAAVIGSYVVSLYAVIGGTPTTRISSIENLVMEEMERLMILQQNLSDLMKLGVSPDYPIRSCGLLPPHYPPGNYYLINGNGDITMQNCSRPPSCYGGSGAWAKVAELLMADSRAQCPTNLIERIDFGLRTCVRSTTRPTCSSSVRYNLDRLEFSRVCGRIIGYQIGSTNAFLKRGNDPLSDPNKFYVDGVSLTHGSPGTHIWTFASAIHDSLEPGEFDSQCDCNVGNSSFPAYRTPGFVGEDYFCDSGLRTGLPTRQTIYVNDPLWDGMGCSSTSTCCTFNNPPWFFKQLRQPTSDHIEMRLCCDEAAVHEDVAIASVELYVQ